MNYENVVRQTQLGILIKLTTMIYFAYGSNMNLNRLTARVPSAIKIENAVLKGYVFKCNKISVDGSSKGNIVQTGNETDQVWGVVFELLDIEKSLLDRAEGLGNGYNELAVVLLSEKGESTNALTYIADSNRVNDNLLPYDWYKNFIVTGSEQNDLPNTYTEMLRAMEFQPDTDETRRDTNNALI